MLKFLFYTAFAFTFYTIGVFTGLYVKEAVAYFFGNYAYHVVLLVLGFGSGVLTMYLDSKHPTKKGK